MRGAAGAAGSGGAGAGMCLQCARGCGAGRRQRHVRRSSPSPALPHGGSAGGLRGGLGGQGRGKERGGRNDPRQLLPDLCVHRGHRRRLMGVQRDPRFQNWRTSSGKRFKRYTAMFCAHAAIRNNERAPLVTLCHRAGFASGFVSVLSCDLNALHDKRGDEHCKSRRCEMFRHPCSKSHPAGQRVQTDHTEIIFPGSIYSFKILFLY